MTIQTDDDQGALDAVIRELRELPADYALTHEEAMEFARRLPARPAYPTSADIIREMRGPLPEDDPYFVPMQDSVTGEWRRVPVCEIMPKIERPSRPFNSAEVIRELRGPFPEDDPDPPPTWKNPPWNRSPNDSGE